MSWIIVMVKWFGSSALCFNNFTSKDCNGRPLKYYRLPREKSIQSKYRKIFKTDGMNWNKGYIRSAHWNQGEKTSINDLPDIPIPADQLQKIRENLKQERIFWKNIKLHHKNYICDTKMPNVN